MHLAVRDIVALTVGGVHIPLLLVLNNTVKTMTDSFPQLHATSRG